MEEDVCGVARRDRQLQLLLSGCSCLPRRAPIVLPICKGCSWKHALLLRPSHALTLERLGRSRPVVPHRQPRRYRSLCLLLLFLWELHRLRLLTRRPSPCGVGAFYSVGEEVEL